MIYNLRRKLVWICGLSVMGVFIVIFMVICILSSAQLNSSMDLLTDRLSQNQGVFPANGIPVPPDNRFGGFINEETPYSTRFFTVHFDVSGRIVMSNTDFISSVTEEQAKEYAEKAYYKGDERGWIGNYRYKLYKLKNGIGVTFVDGSSNIAMTNALLWTSGLVLLGSSLIIIVIILVFSKRAVKPIAESYEKQQQFITDANHELKTPLTLILANLDIIESELGKSEWIDDIRVEGNRMSLLINRLLTLSRMDEQGKAAEFSLFNLSDAVYDTTCEFEAAAKSNGKVIFYNIAKDITVKGDEGMIRQMTGILLDNAVKYCDLGGVISVSLTPGKHKVLTVENAYKDVDSVELGKLFDRFYRADKARTSSNSFGIGLSIAKSVMQTHGGDIKAYKKDGAIGFKATFK